MAAYKDEARGTWYVSFHYNDWTGKNKRKLKRGFRTRKEALEYEQKFLLQQATNLDMGFEDFYKLYEEDLKPKLKLNTWRTKDVIFQKKLIPYFKDKKMNEISPADIIKWQNEMIKKRQADGKLSRGECIDENMNIKRLAQSGVSNYSNTVKHWIENSDYNISEEKKKALETMFAKSHVSVIYGAAGTGKTTFINYISNFFKEYSKLYLAYTNPAVNNLKRKVAATSDCEFMTISKFNNRYNNDIKRKYDIIFIDECSTVSNKEMKEFLELADYKLLVLVGDTYQIESIEFGNWFDTIRGFLPESAICELIKPYRSNSKQLQALWDNVRKMEDDILDRLQAGGYSVNLDPSILTPASENEIILCLNYGGLYGINNINHFMQENNNGKEIRRGIQRYKVGDPILFNDLADSFFTKNKEQVPIIHNNMKGRIEDFRLLEAGKVTERIQFDIEIDKPLMNLDDKDLDFQVIGVSEKGNSIIRFEVYKNKSTDEDDDSVSKNMVPFQIAYAVSIHKAQGLEYDSVKIIITDDIDEREQSRPEN